MLILRLVTGYMYNVLYGPNDSLLVSLYYVRMRILRMYLGILNTGIIYQIRT